MNNAELHTQLVARNELIDAQAAQLIAARAQVAELSVTVEQLQAQLRERNEDVARKDAQIAEADAMMHELQEIILELELRLHDHLIDALEPVAVNGEGQ